MKEGGTKEGQEGQEEELEEGKTHTREGKEGGREQPAAFGALLGWVRGCQVRGNGCEGEEICLFFFFSCTHNSLYSLTRRQRETHTHTRMPPVGYFFSPPPLHSSSPDRHHKTHTKD